RLKRFLRGAGGEAPDRFLAMLTRMPDDARFRLYAPELRTQVPGGFARTHFRTLHRAGGDRTGLDAGLYLDYKTFLADDILALSDRLSMAHSLEIRVPFVDHELASRIFSLPDRVKIGRWETKRLLRRALSARLPPEHLRAPKRGFVGPTSA